MYRGTIKNRKLFLTILYAVVVAKLMADVIQRNAVKVTGTGKETIVLAAGYGVDQRIWRKLLPHFEADYSLVLFDYVGAGSSDRTLFSQQRYSTLTGYAQDVLEILETLKLRDVIFIGHSVSSIIGLLAAIQRPEYFSSLVFVSPSACYVNDNLAGLRGGYEKEQLDEIMTRINSNYLDWAREVIPTVVNNADKPELIQEILAMFLDYDEKIAQSFALSPFFCDHRMDLLKLKTPCLILPSSQDPMAPLQVGDYLHAHLQNSKLKVMKTRGHFPQLTGSDEVNSLIEDYLKVNA
jgi:sigma-B regulation protein RsbQ